MTLMDTTETLSNLTPTSSPPAAPPPPRPMLDRVATFGAEGSVLAASLVEGKSLHASDPAWLAERRAAAYEVFQDQGLPTRHDEDWQESGIQAIHPVVFTPSTGATPSAATLAQLEIPGLIADAFVLVDGAIQQSIVGDLPEGAYVGSLAEAIAANHPAVEQHLGQHANPEHDALVALNTLDLNDGVLVYVPAGVTLPRPIHIGMVSAADTGSKTSVAHSRVLVVVEAGGSADVIEHHVGSVDADGSISKTAQYLANSVTEYIVGEKAVASHTFICRESDAAFNTSTLASFQETESDFTSHAVLLSGLRIRNSCRPTLAGERIESLLNGLYLPAGTGAASQIVDNLMYVHHQQPGCHSRQYYAGVLTEEGKGVFAGRIKVERAAQQTDAVQSSRNLLLDDGAHAHCRPQLEIFADDVKCTHGSTTGELDDPSVLYLRSRGIPMDQARAMLVFAFANESIQRVENDAVRHFLAGKVVTRLGMNEDAAIVFADDDL